MDDVLDAYDMACFGQWDGILGLLTRENVHAMHPDLGTTLVHWASGACSSTSEAALRLALSLGADPNARDAEDWSPLCYAAYRGSVDVMRVLIDAGGDVGAVTDRGQTPLIILLQTAGDSPTVGGDPDTVARLRVLLSSPTTDLQVRYEGKTAHEWAQEAGLEHLASLVGNEVRHRA
jgi:ankyrin repeat protein